MSKEEVDAIFSIFWKPSPSEMGKLIIHPMEMIHPVRLIAFSACVLQAKCLHMSQRFVHKTIYEIFLSYKIQAPKVACICTIRKKSRQKSQMQIMLWYSMKMRQIPCSPRYFHPGFCSLIAINCDGTSLKFNLFIYLLQRVELELPL